MKNASVRQPTLYETVVLSFVIPSEAEGSAVPRTLLGNDFRPSSGEICGSPLRAVSGSKPEEFNTP
jgi:hypothetical protein